MELTKKQFNQLTGILQHARHLVSTPEKWCKKRIVSYNPSTGAHSYCMVGALHKATKARHAVYNAAYLAFCNANPEIPNNHISTWNDSPSRTHSEVLAAFDKAIAYCQVRAEADTPKVSTLTELPGVPRGYAKSFGNPPPMAPMLNSQIWVTNNEPVNATTLQAQYNTPYPFSTKQKETQ